MYLLLGSRLRTRRDALEMTQQQLSEKVGVSRASIANIERGRQNVLLHHLYALAKALDMPNPADLLPSPINDNKAADVAIQTTGNPINDRERASVKEFISKVAMSQTIKARP